MEYRFIENKGDYFNPGFFTEDFLQKVKNESGKTPEEIKALRDRFSPLNVAYNEYKKQIVNGRMSTKFKIRRTHEFHTELLRMLGYATDRPYSDWIYLDDSSVVPARHIIHDESGRTKVVVMEMQSLIPIGDSEPDGLFQQYYDEGEDVAKGQPQRYRFCDWQETINLPLPEGVRIRPAVINRAIDEIFQQGEEKARPQFVLMLAGNKVFLLDCKEWYRGSYVIFDIDELLIEAASGRKDYLALFYLLVSCESLTGKEETPLMSRIHEASVRNAVSVTKDLKEGVINAVEEIANEAIYQLKQRNRENEIDAVKLRDDALTLVYRLLFLFYAEARPELGILPMRDDAYLRGYSLEMLRDLEQVPMHSQDSRSGYFFDRSIRRLFRLINQGYNDHDTEKDSHRFVIKKIDSPLFDDSNLNLLADIPLRNEVWQRIIESLSLSQEKGRQRRGRISYANLGINQLGSVYESLLAYRGFYTEEDYIEVHAAGKPEEGTYLVPRSRMDDFVMDDENSDKDEILRDKDGKPLIHPKGKFLYRLNGRDRKKSASYYTPEVLTRSTVKYTLKGFRDRLEKGEMTSLDLLDLKILEPAMGAAAFQNEVINQLAEMFLEVRQKELKAQGRKTWRVPTEHRQRELQKVKAYIAVKNTYGVDLNRTAIELGKLALWLNVMYPDMETPWFSHHLAWGNAVIGAWFKTVKVEAGEKHDYSQQPKKIEFSKKDGAVKGRKRYEIYHFLIPDPKMLGILNDKETKKTADATLIKKMTDIRKGWTQKLCDKDVDKLRWLSDRIDRFIKDVIREQKKIDALTEPSIPVWSLEKTVGVNFNYGEKQKLTETRNQPGTAFARLKAVMDYWSALWFWKVEDANELPDRNTYWNDLARILSTYVTEGERIPFRASLFEESKQLSIWDAFEEQIEVTVKKPIEDIYDGIVNDKKNQEFQYDNSRLQIVRRLAERYRFFHPMLEFIEVFASRGGFDIVAGNPPWLKLDFKNEEVAADFFPEVVLHKLGASKTADLLSRFKETEKFEHFYQDELYEYQGSIAFMNADVNYKLLNGQQTNLFKCVLVNGFDLLNHNGFMGMLHPDGVYEDPDGKILREEIYQRLRYHFQYENQLMLFPEVLHNVKFSSNVYGGKQKPNFKAISNLFYPTTIDDSLSHSGYGDCHGIKKDGKWNTEGHKDRVIRFNEPSLRIVARTFEKESLWNKCKLISIHNNKIIGVLDRLSLFQHRTVEAQKIISEGLHETYAVSDGTMRRATRYPEMSKREMIFSGPHVYVANPLYKNPREVCTQKDHYDIINHNSIKDDFIPRTNYVPRISALELRDKFDGFDNDHKWTDFYHIAFRKMLSQVMERTLTGAIIPPNTSHILGLISVTFPTKEQTVEFAGLTSSIVLDFYIKTIGASNLYENRINSFPLGIDEKYRRALYVRTLMLNCLTTWYAPLWEEMWRDDFKDETWSIDDDRLRPFSTLTPEWQRNNALRNYFERRQTLVEIDVITAMALGLSLEDLEMIYNIQFPVLQQNENETYYDRDGNIAFTVSRGLTGVGMTRQEWNAIPDKSAYTLCDRVADYRRAWSHFSQIFNK